MGRSLTTWIVALNVIFVCGFAGTIDLEEFTNVWLKFCDLRYELERRGVEVPGWATKTQLRKLLRQQLDADADKERKAMAEARRWRQWQVW